MKPLDLIRTAEQILEHEGSNPTEADLRRALSTAYYALFHYICRECADRLAGCREDQQRKPAWRQTYRALHHKEAKRRCLKVKGSNELNFPASIRDFASLFITMQEHRHRADYDTRPSYTTLNVSSYIQDAKAMIESTDRVAAKHRKALAVYLVMPIRDEKGH